MGGPESYYRAAVMHAGCQRWEQKHAGGRDFDKMMSQLIFQNFFPYLLWLVSTCLISTWCHAGGRSKRSHCSLGDPGTLERGCDTALCYREASVVYVVYPHPQIHIHLETQTVTLSGNGVFADVLSLGSCDGIMLGLGWVLNRVTGVLRTRG